MMCKATLTTESKDGRAVAESLNADNVRMDRLVVRTACRGNHVVSQITADSTSTLLSTIDDLIRCQITSESMIKDGN